MLISRSWRPFKALTSGMRRMQTHRLSTPSCCATLCVIRKPRAARSRGGGQITADALLSG
jgi:hypothetical protein